ncbi:hypothetical protein M4D81_10245 [Paenibacillus sp. p3-SID867]|uniref:hypothetical protein n=1 Tax=Paenibacillus sp. p3-SID867 TaxID=2916363 RepID=UPI0021A2CEE0|nr:hypothetical protein [Paenibacillus sp. p3-SID867]MCT1399400.1 hypothetical protein [Paenibacillus sp. p3-SID867]
MKIVKHVLIFFVLIVITSCKTNSDISTTNYVHLIEQPVALIESKLEFTPEIPTYIPINVTEATASLESYETKQGKFQEVVYHHRNINKQQLYNLIITYDETDEIYSEESIARGKESHELERGIQGYYDEDDDDQSLWWRNNGLTYRFVYFLNEGQPRLDKQEFIQSANSVPGRTNRTRRFIRN